MEIDYNNAKMIWACEDTGKAPKYVYVLGGYNNPDRGGVWPWGDTKYSEVYFIGDNAGVILIEYADGSNDEIPLVFGYTLWWREHWNMASLPFKGKGADENLSMLLQRTLHLYGAYEGNEVCKLRIGTEGNKAIKAIYLAKNILKSGAPDIKAIEVYCDDNDIMTYDEKAFFLKHTVKSVDPFPEEIKDNLDILLSRVTTCEEQWQSAPVVEYKEDYVGPKIKFSGTPFANIATGVIQFSTNDVGTRMKENGLFPESLDSTEQYIYAGIGTYYEGGAYANRMYSRNKVIFTLDWYGFRDKAQRVTDYVNRMLMYYPEHNITILGRQIPGHMTMLVNDPHNYRNTGFSLTKYKDESIYGKDAWNLSNTEQDGHGLMMMSNYVVWKASGSRSGWVNRNWEYIREAAEWIVWCFDNKDITFCNDYVLYAESEGCFGWMGYSLYCNEPCYFGLKGYIEMAEKAGRTEEAARWKEYEGKFREGILKRFTKPDGSWDFAEEGKDRDPTLSFMSYMYGYDLDDMDKDFVERSRKSYDEDLKEMIEKNDGYWGTWGTGYDHCTMLQNAMFFDKMDDATILMNNLSRICYAPGYPNPYGVPESFAVDSKRNILRRTGDFENLVHTCDALLAYLVAIGVSPVIKDGAVLKIMPRLAEGWNVSVDNFTVPGTNAEIGLEVNFPEYASQSVAIKINRADTISTVKFRFGPFPINTESVTTTINGRPVINKAYISGDRFWTWVEFGVAEGDEYLLEAKYL